MDLESIYDLLKSSSFLFSGIVKLKKHKQPTNAITEKIINMYYYFKLLTIKAATIIPIIIEVIKKRKIEL